MDLPGGVELQAYYLPSESRMRRPSSAENVAATEAAQRRLVDTGKMPRPQPGTPSLLGEWVSEKWGEALDRWFMFGGPVMHCEHVDLDAEQEEPYYWLVRYPDAHLCKACCDRVRAAVEWVCDYCGEEAVTGISVPGATIYAVLILCRVCEGADDVPAGA
jgi:hypothetical protein